ncbi:P-loop NTPase fold protein [Segatella copri]|uniref:P-loop NTPase fold protein n=1 Tax=Segatella copri TaxID=165179 RepID=UPI001C44F202|nr:P-loop NTPase fold protein [Segatella copri]MBW0029502.1 KAP family NTPase [Segatella copri]
MNENIVNFLNGYMMNPDPQYAVLLKGKWGCGKTHFINHWIDAYKGNPTTEQVLEPIYVSLYGLSDTKQITTALNRVICPILYGKAAKAGKVLAKIASAMVLKHEVDLNYDGISDLSINIGIDSLSKFKSNDSLANSKKLLIFDDLERCDIPMKKLLGYLNFFVEQCNCHLIVIGDEDKIAEGENKKIFGEFKEKTIGREFEIATDLHSALDTFVNQTPKNDFVVGHQEQIEKFFAMTECDNLRILRQALWDFSRFEESMTDFLGDSRYEDIMIHVLGTYIISYCEYRGKNHQLFDAWIQYAIKGQQFDKEKIENLKLQLGDLHQRYNNIYQRLSNYQTFKIEFVERVLLELNTGNSIKDYVGKEYFAPIAEVRSWARINEVYAMSNKDFISFYRTLIDDICGIQVTSMKNLGHAIAYLVYLDSRAIKEFDEKDFNNICEALPKYWEAFQDEESVYDARMAFSRGVNSYMTTEKLKRLPEICAKFNEEYENRLKMSKNLMTRTLEELSDSNVDELCTLNKQALPDHSCTYDMVSIFNHVDMDKLMDNLLNLSNESLNSFTHFIRDRYKLSYNMSDWIHETNDDIKPLEKLKEKVDEIIKTEEYIRKAAFMNLSKSLDGAIKRCKGDMHATTF